MNRKDALALLKSHVETDRILRHSLAVEAAMIAYAEYFNEDPLRFGLLGLLHDIDFEKYPDQHPNKSPEILLEAGFDHDFVDSILSHGTNSEIARDRLERKCLHAVDEMASFIIAVALMRPEKLEGLTGKSVKKKMKDKPFARAVDREELISSMEELGMEFNEHVSIIVEGLKRHHELVKEDGMQLL